MDGVVSAQTTQAPTARATLDLVTRPLAVDRAWQVGGIGTHAAEVVSRLRPSYDLIEVRSPADQSATRPSAPLELSLNRASVSGVAFYSPGYFPPLWWRGPTFVTVHDLQYLGAASDALRRRYMTLLLQRLRRVDRILTVSKESATELADHLDPDRISVVGNGVSEAFFDAYDHHRRPAPGAPPRVIYVGSVMPYKRVDRLVEVVAATARLLAHPIELSLPAEAVALHGSLLATTPEVVVLERPAGLDNVALAAEVAAADLYLSLSNAEGFGLPPLEALAAGTRVCCVDLPGALTRYGSAATLVDADAGIGETARVVAGILDEDPSTRHALVRKGARHAAGYSWDDVAARVRDVIETTIG